MCLKCVEINNSFTHLHVLLIHIKSMFETCVLHMWKFFLCTLYTICRQVNMVKKFNIYNGKFNPFQSITEAHFIKYLLIN